jgi:O-antigen/teichoic acid export membrane protein
MESLRSFARKIELDKAVLYGVLGKVWSILIGPVTALLIATHFSPALQGYYYTFSTILALQIFVELGLGIVTQQFASHEWSELRINESGEIEGNSESLSRLISISKISSKWFLYGGLIVGFGLMAGGYLFFSSAPTKEINWQYPWIFLSLLTGVSILFVPFWSLLEGCNQVKNLYGFRLLLALISGVATWICIFFGIGIWTAVIGTGVSILLSFCFIRFKYWTFFRRLLFESTTGPRVEWGKDMLPMQWRIAISWISGYFSFYLFTPVLFKYQGPEIAGRFGMTWNIIAALGSISGAWLTPRVPKFAMLAAKGNYQELDRIFWRVVKIIFFLILGLSFLAALTVYLLPFLHLTIADRLSSRLIPLFPLCILLVAQVLQVTSTPFSSYMRAHKKEPLMYLSLLNGFLVACVVLFFGKYYSINEIALGYLAINAVIIPTCIYIWYKFRKEHMQTHISK